MNFTHYDLGQLAAGDVVEVTLAGNAANVRLMDAPNFSNYRSGRAVRYLGGLAKRSPIRLRVAHSGHWHVAVDLAGLRGSTKTAVRVLRT